MPTLYEISSDLAALAEILRESAGEITPEAEAGSAGADGPNTRDQSPLERP